MTLGLDLLLEFVDHLVELLNFVLLGADEHLELLSLNVDVGALLLCSLLLATALLHRCDKRLEVSRSQPLVRISLVATSLLLCMLYRVVVLGDHFRGALTPL